jgi:hypothetical protein
MTSVPDIVQIRQVIVVFQTESGRWRLIRRSGLTHLNTGSSQMASCLPGRWLH